MKLTRTGWILAIYYAVLLLSVAAMYLLPPDRLLNPPAGFYSRQELLEMQETFLETVLAGKEPEMDGIVLASERRFDLEGDALQIGSDGPLDAIIVISYKKSDDRTVEVREYRTRTVYGNLDFTELIPPVDVTLEGNGLRLREPRFQLDVVEMRKERTVSQFGGRTSSGWSGGSVHLGSAALFVTIPEHVAVYPNGHMGNHIIWPD